MKEHLDQQQVHCYKIVLVINVKILPLSDDFVSQIPPSLSLSFYRDGLKLETEILDGRPRLILAASGIFKNHFSQVIFKAY